MIPSPFRQTGEYNLTFFGERNQLREENSKFIRKGRGKKEGKDGKKRKRGRKEDKKGEKKEHGKKIKEKGEKGNNKLVQKFRLRHTLEIFQMGREFNLKKKFGGKEIKLQ